MHKTPATLCSSLVPSTPNFYELLRFPHVLVSSTRGPATILPSMKPAAVMSRVVISMPQIDMRKKWEWVDSCDLEEVR